MYPLRALYYPLLQFTSLYSALQHYLPLSSLDRHNRIHTTKCFGLMGYALCLSPKFIEYSMKTSPSFSEDTFSNAVMTRLTWRYRDRELITASSFKLLKTGNMSWILGLDIKSLKQNHSRTSLLTLKNRNSTTLLYSHFASYAKKSRHWAIPTTRHSYTVVNLDPHPQ